MGLDAPRLMYSSIYYYLSFARKHNSLLFRKKLIYSDFQRHMMVPTLTCLIPHNRPISYFVQPHRTYSNTMAVYASLGTVGEPPWMRPTCLTLIIAHPTYYASDVLVCIEPRPRFFILDRLFMTVCRFIRQATNAMDGRGPKVRRMQRI